MPKKNEFSFTILVSPPQIGHLSGIVKLLDLSILSSDLTVYDDTTISRFCKINL